MAPPHKNTPEQQQFIELWMTEFLQKKAAKELDNFWPKMQSAYLSEWPEETVLGLPVQEVNPDPNAEPSVPLTDEQRERLDKALGVRISQLHNLFFNAYTKIRNQRGGVGRSSILLAAQLFKARPKGRRRHQTLEVYQKVHKIKVQEALRKSEYDALNEASQCRDEDGEWIDDDDDKVKMKRVASARSTRMKVWRRVVQELWDSEDEKVQDKIREMAKREVLEPPKEEGVNGERSPEQYQMSIDEIPQVATMFLSEFHRMTGWMGVLVAGGPVPRAQGELGAKIVSFGVGPGALGFDKWHSNWKKAVTTPLFKFLRQAIPREVRLSRAIFTGEDDDTAKEPEEVDGEAAVNNPQKKKKKSKDVIAPCERTAPAVSTPTASATPEPAASGTPAPAASATPAPAASATPAPAASIKPARRPKSKNTPKVKASLTNAALPATSSADPSEVATVAFGPPAQMTAVELRVGADPSQASQMELEGGDLVTANFGSAGFSFDAGESGGGQFGTRDFAARDFGSADFGGADFGGANFELFESGFSAVDNGFSENGVSPSRSDFSSTNHSPSSFGMPSTLSGTQEIFTFPQAFGTAGLGTAPQQLVETGDFERAHTSLFGAGAGLLLFSAGQSSFTAGQSSFAVGKSAFGEGGSFGGGGSLFQLSQPRPTPRPRSTSSGSSSSSFSFERPGQYRSSYHFNSTGATGTSPTHTGRSLVVGAGSQTPVPTSTSSSPTSGAAAPGTPHLAPLPRLPPGPASTPKCLPSTPARSSPLARPPWQGPAANRSTTPPPPQSLPPRLRPSPTRNPSSPAPPTPPSPPVYPQSRPMANPPKKAAVKASPRTVAKKMAEVQGAKKVMGKKTAAARAASGSTASVGSKTKEAGESAVSGSTVAGSVVSGSAVSGSAVLGSTVSGSAASGSVAAGGQEQQHAEPVPMYTLTNNNAARLREERARDEAKKKEREAKKAENMRLHNPAGGHDLFITEGRRPARSVVAPKNRSAVISIVDKARALEAKAKAEDDALLKALEAGKKNTGKKRKADAGENVAPVSKRAKKVPDKLVAGNAGSMTTGTKRGSRR
ncbi:hypothetical protein DFH09DRAFT_1311424 [Mycena vulgaris]|nr:hypothetical protein DFH09DRAFT_1311424 [Mycena vulgaris]